MQYFFLEKQSTLTQRWKVRQIAFDPRYCYLYYSAPISRTALEDVPDTGSIHSFSAHSYHTVCSDAPTVTWRQCIKVTGLRYLADDYSVPPTSSDFEEKVLLTLVVTGYERPMESKSNPKLRPRNLNRSSGSMAKPAKESDDPNVELNGNHTADPARPDPQLPSTQLHWHSYHFSSPLQEGMEDEDEDAFRDIELVPDSDPNDLDDEESPSEEENDSDSVLESPASRSVSSMPGRTTFLKTTSGGCWKTVSLQFRARNYDAFRVVSLKLRQGLVRHGRCPPLHRGLPPYDPRSGIALATIPLHLRYQFRRLNDVVLYSFQRGHAVYVRGLREVRGLSGYLCITHDSVLLLQADGKCPRWLDLEDITGIDYVLEGSHSFVSILAASPMPDFVFIPVFPQYPPCSGFDAEDAVEGVVGLLRRLLMQRLRSQEPVSLPRLPKKNRINPNDAMDVGDYDTLCHIRRLSHKFSDVFSYIAQQGAGRPMQWRWSNSKTPTHFTYKKDLYEALKHEGSDDDDASSEEGPVAVVPKVHSRGDDLECSRTSTAASITAMTVAQLLAPPCKDAEMRARARLKLTRIDPGKRNPPTGPVKPESFGLVHAHHRPDYTTGDIPQVATANRGVKLPPPPPTTQPSRSTYMDPNNTDSHSSSEEGSDDEDDFDSEDVDDLLEERQTSQLESPGLTYSSPALRSRRSLLRRGSNRRGKDPLGVSSEEDEVPPLPPASLQRRSGMRVFLALSGSTSGAALDQERTHNKVA